MSFLFKELNKNIVMPKKKHRKREKRKGKEDKVTGDDFFEERIEHLAAEMEALGKKIEHKGGEWNTWFRRTFGVAGPLISSIFGIIVLAASVWALRFVNFFINNAIVAGIHNFLFMNIGWFFLIFIFFSYSGYLSRAHPKVWKPVSPFSAAVGIGVGLWILVNAINVVNYFVSSSILHVVSFQISNYTLAISSLALVIGYVLLLVRGEEVGVASMGVKGGETVTRAAPARAARSSGSANRLYRSGREKILGGVCGGIAEHIDVDPVIVRLLWVFLSLAWGAGILFYIIAWIIIPRNPNHKWD
jgi:phage shock protein PspC (stress-responsive transcriptional regulator)